MSLAGLLTKGGADKDDPRLVEALRKACELGVADGCFAAGKQLQGTESDMRMPKRALEYFERACGAGHAQACYQAGRGRQGSEERSRAVEYFRMACQQKIAEACAELGQALAWGSSPDWTGVFAAHLSACELGIVRSCTIVGDQYRARSGAVVDAATAGRAFDKGCQAGDGHCCNELGFMRIRGKLPRDDAKSVEEFRKSCNAGNQSGCDSLGFMLMNGKGGTEADAAKVFTSACAKGNPFACLNQGLMQWFSRGGLKDKKEAAERITRACYQRSRYYLQSECSGGDPESCAAGAVLAGTGQCGVKDVNEAKHMAKTACSAGYTWACARLKEVGITP